MISTLLAALLLSPAAASPIAAAPTAIVAPIPTGENCAETKIWTPENDEWFHQLIRLNPRASIVVAGRGITVCNPVGVPLVLPDLITPPDVRLSVRR